MLSSDNFRVFEQGTDKNFTSDLLNTLRLLTHRSFWKTWSDTFKSVLIYGKEQECLNSFITVEKVHLPEKVWP